MNLSNENRLLVLCAGTGMSPDRLKLIKSVLSLPIEWDTFVSTALSKGIAPLVYPNVKNLSERGPIPEEVVASLRSSYHSNVARNMYLYAELTEVLRALSEQEVEVMMLKGAALARSVYGQIGLRTMGDLDLLVRQESLPRVKDIMSELGYVPANVKPEEWYREKHFHLPPYVHKEKSGVIIEIHWHVCRASLGINVNEWWERADTMNLGEISALIPSPEDMILHLCISIYQDNYQKAAMRSLCDISETLLSCSGEMDWKLFHEAVGKSEIAMPVHSILFLVRKYFAGTQQLLSWLNPEHVNLKLSAMLKEIIFGEDDISYSAFMRWVAADTNWKKVKKISSDLFPSQEKMSERYSVQPASLKVYLYYAYRPIELAVKYGRSLMALFRFKNTFRW